MSGHIVYMTFYAPQIRPDALTDFLPALRAAERDGARAVHIYFGSGGGELHGALAIATMIGTMTVPIYMHGIGTVGSAGWIIFLAVPRERRSSDPTCQFMCHPCWQRAKTPDDTTLFNARELRGMLRRALMADQAMIALMEKEGMGFPGGREEIVRLHSEEHILPASWALEHGYVSRIGTLKPLPTFPINLADAPEFIMGEESACP